MSLIYLIKNQLINHWKAKYNDMGYVRYNAKSDRLILADLSFNVLLVNT